MSVTEPVRDLPETDAPRRGGFLSYFARHPKGFWFIFWGELAERSSYYGMRVLLVTYMTTVLHFQREWASDVAYYFKAAAYFTPLIGGLIADNFLGKYWTIVIFSVPYILGHLLLGIEQPLWLYLGLGFLAFGTGIIKPNISTLMGMTYDQKRPGDIQLRTDAFFMFYFAINIGATISMAVLPIVSREYSYFLAFLIPAILMVMALAAFASGKPYYAVEIIERKTLTPEEKAQRWTLLGRLFGVFALIALWWFVYEQNDIQWVYLATDSMEMQVTDTIRLEPNQIQAVNGFLILVLLPVVSLFFRWVDPTATRFPATRKMFYGFLLMAATQVILGGAALLASGGIKVSVLWMLVAYVVFTLSEVLVSTVGLELAFSAAPSSMKSFVTAVFLLTTFLGNILGSQVTSKLWSNLGPQNFFFAMAGLMVAVALVFIPVARQFNRSQAPA